MHIKTASLSVILSVALMGCSEVIPGGPANNPSNTAEPPLVDTIQGLPGETWNVATVGIKVEPSSLSKGQYRLTSDIWLIDKSSGETYSLLAVQKGERIEQAIFLSGKPQPLQDLRHDSGVHIFEDDTFEDDTPAKFYVLTVKGKDKKLTLFGGSIEDRKTTKIGGTFSSLLHMDVLPDEQLAIYVLKGDIAHRMVVDLGSMSETETARVAP